MSGVLRSYSSAADAMKAPPGYYASAAFAHLRWTAAGEQRDEGMRLFCRKLLKRLDHLDMPFYPAVGLMDLSTARWRHAVGMDRWKPMESPFLDGIAIRFKHCIHDELDPKCWALFGEIGFDVARLMSLPVLWGGFSEVPDPGLFAVYKKPAIPEGMRLDRHTYGARNAVQLDVGIIERASCCPVKL